MPRKYMYYLSDHIMLATDLEYEVCEEAAPKTGCTQQLAAQNSKKSRSGRRHRVQGHHNLYVPVWIDMLFFDHIF